MDVQNVTRSSKWVCVKLRSNLHAFQGSQITTQMDMLKSGESDNQAKNLPGYLLSDIKRRSLSLLLDRIPRKKGALLLVSERQDSVAVVDPIGNGGWC